jgi:hypothetical protein
VTETQLLLFPEFRSLPVYDECDPRADVLTNAGVAGYERIRECPTLQDVKARLKDGRCVPLGALRAGPPGRQVVVAYFGERG